MLCLYCNKEFQPKRKTAKYCSGKCRIASLRKIVSVTDSVTKVTVTPKISVTPVIVTNPKIVVGKCKWCGRDITPEVYGSHWDLIECCYTCTAQGTNPFNRNKLKRETYPVDL